MFSRPLIISNNPLCNKNNNGKTLEAIFDKYNKDNLSQLFFTEYLIPDFNYCKNYFRITNKDVLKNFFIKNYSDELYLNSKFDFSNNRLFLKNTKILYLHLLRDLLWSFNTWKTRKLFSWVEKNKPDFIFFVAGGDKFSHNVAIYISKKYNIPLLTFFTDDYILSENVNSILNKIIIKRRINYYKFLVNKSNLCFVICKYMAVEYENFFLKNFHILNNAVNIKDNFSFKYSINPIIINYFGNLHTNRDIMLLKFANILQNIKCLNIELNVFTNSIPDDSLLFKFNNMNIKYKGNLVGDELYDEMRSSTFLLHLENDDLDSIAKTRLSLSTKIPEYLITSRLIISFGPPEVASFRIQSDNDIGFILNSRDSLFINTNKLYNLFLSEKRQFEITKNAYYYAKENFNKNNQNALITSLLNKI